MSLPSLRFVIVQGSREFTVWGKTERHARRTFEASECCTDKHTYTIRQVNEDYAVVLHDERKAPGA